MIKGNSFKIKLFLGLQLCHPKRLRHMIYYKLLLGWKELGVQNIELDICACIVHEHEISLCILIQ